MSKATHNIANFKNVSNGDSDVRHGLFAETGGSRTAPTDSSTSGRRGRSRTSRIAFAGKRPDLPDTSDTLKKAKPITKPQTKPELGI